jgi:hypothetical protein
LHQHQPESTGWKHKDSLSWQGAAFPWNYLCNDG